MAKTIYKYAIERPSDRIIIEMPRDAEILTAATQNAVPTIWAIVDPTAPLVRVEIFVVGTGHPLEHGLSKMQYIGTCHDVGGMPLVFHLFRGTVV